VNEKLANVQVLRGVACLLVVAFHLADIEARFGLGFNPLKPVRWFGYAGVDLFFVLSGFIIATTARPDLGRPRALPGYLFRRLWRVYPAYWAALGVAAGVYLALSPDPLFRTGWPVEAVDSLLLLPQPTLSRLLPVAWTLSFEVMFYLAFAVLFVLPRGAIGVWLAAWAGGVAWAAAAGVAPANRFAGLAASPFVLEFLAGCTLAFVRPPLSRRTAAALVALAVGWAAAGSILTYRPDHAWLVTHLLERVFVFGPAAVLVLFALVGYERAGGRLPWPRLAAVGNASYAIYLLHFPAFVAALYLTMLVKWGHAKGPHVVWLAAMLAAGVLPGLLFHRVVERPLLRLGTRRPRPPAIPVEPLPTRRAA